MRFGLLLALSALMLLAGCVQHNVIPLGSVEVGSYNGTRLDSVNDIPEVSIKGPQYVNITNYHLLITGMVNKQLNLTYDEVLAYQAYSKVVTLNCVEGWSAKILWQGVRLKDLLDAAGVNPGADTVIFHAVDGYTTSLSYKYIVDNNILLAYKMNDITLPPERGYPFMLVAENKWGYKWIKWVDAIELSNNSNYTGYWESRGYSETGNLNESKYS